jgi:ABC-type Zn2+ transport system substrate-binding protein/surface adhesin
MEENRSSIHSKIAEELNRRFPDHKPKIAKIDESSFIYELEKHDNYTYFSVGYTLTPSGTLKIDWEKAELTVI